LDDQWAYMRVHGDPGWDRFPSFFDRAVPRMLDTLGGRGLTVTVFVVGQDAALERNGEVLTRIRDIGHEIGNHSFHHRPSFAHGSRQEIDREIEMAEEAIERATGLRPVGFRGPGFSVSKDLLRVLKRRGYAYDASTFPTFIGPLARAYYEATVRDGSGRSAERNNLYGGWRDGTRPLNPYLWRLPEGPLLEVPVTTFPCLRVPFHMTYVTYLYARAPRLALAYLRCALQACRLSGTVPSMLLHPLDFLGADDVPELAFFPGMSLTGQRKTDLVDRVLGMLCADFVPATLRDYTQLIAHDGGAMTSRAF
jgi:hypothetical protein